MFSYHTVIRMEDSDLFRVLLTLRRASTVLVMACLHGCSAGLELGKRKTRRNVYYFGSRSARPFDLNYFDYRRFHYSQDPSSWARNATLPDSHRNSLDWCCHNGGAGPNRVQVELSPPSFVLLCSLLGLSIGISNPREVLPSQ